MKKANIKHVSLLAMAPSLLASTVGGGWAPGSKKAAAGSEREDLSKTPAHINCTFLFFAIVPF